MAAAHNSAPGDEGSCWSACRIRRVPARVRGARRPASEAGARADAISFVAQCLDGFEFRGASCGEKPGENADRNRKEDCSRQQPPWRVPKILRRHLELTEIDVGAEIDGAT